MYRSRSETEQSLLSSPPPPRGRRTPGVQEEAEQRTQHWAEQNLGWLSSCSLLAPTTTIPSPYPLAWHCTAFSIQNRQYWWGEGRVQILGSYLCNFGWHNNSVCTQYPHPHQHSVYHVLHPWLVATRLVGVHLSCKTWLCTNTFQGAENFPIPSPACTVTSTQPVTRPFSTLTFTINQRSFCFMDISA